MSVTLPLLISWKGISACPNAGAARRKDAHNNCFVFTPGSDAARKVKWTEPRFMRQLARIFHPAERGGMGLAVGRALRARPIAKEPSMGPAARGAPGPPRSNIFSLASGENSERAEWQSLSSQLSILNLAPVQFFTSVPILSPMTALRIACSSLRSNTRIGTLLSMQSENAVESMTLSRCLSASMKVS